MESVNQAGRGLLEVGSGDSPNGLQARLEELNDSWEFVRCETEHKQLELENRLSQVRRQFFLLDINVGFSLIHHMVDRDHTIALSCVHF